jgi:hypothetical protein
MVAFRRVITALAVLALFTGFALAQVGPTGQPLSCTTQVAVTPQLRGEGFTEQTGDITINCTGGSTLAPGSPIPLINVTVSYNATVTSRLLASGTTNVPSEALLLIDEPGSGLTGYGPSLPQILCTTPLTGCPAWVGFPTLPNPPGASPNPSPVTALGGNQASPNVYQGVLPAATSGNRSVTFFGVPVMPPTTTGNRVFRITNVRVDATPLIGGSASGASPIQASIAISGATSLPITNPTPIVGFVSAGLTATASSAGNLNQCSSQTKTSVNTLTFTENFGTAFKTRVAAQSSTLYAGQIGNPVQNVPGGIYNSESNFVFTGATNGSAVAGLADFGTRLKATFNNIPSGVRVFVSTVNVNNNAFPISTANPPVPPGCGSAAGCVAGSNLGNTSASSPYVGLAQLINGENTSDGGVGGFQAALITATDNGPSGGNVPIAEVSIDPTSKSGSAVWEVVNTNPNTPESFKFAVYITYVAAVATNSPLPGNSTVNLSFAPTATSGVPSSTASIPRFIGSSAAASNIFTINICRTILLYPYLTNQGGFDTGLSIANTSQDSIVPITGASNAAAQSGSCTLTWFGGTTAAPTVPPAASNTGTIAAGTVWVNTLQTLAPTFQGYMFAVCNFQYAHGFAFISDVGARNLAMGYLALVIPDPGTGSRPASPGGCIGVDKCNTGGEQDSH